MYLPRHIEEVIKKTAQIFPAVVITGSRQIGKTTLLQQILPEASYTTLDRVEVFEAALDSPERFLLLQEEPAIIDEVQYAPTLFRSIKILADQEKGKKGRFFLTGSQRYAMMQGVDESMAGRAGIIEMLGLSLREINQDLFNIPFLPTETYIKARQKSLSSQKKLDESSLWEIIFKGDLPELHSQPSLDASLYYNSYIETYLRRDVGDLAHVGDLLKFNRFMVLAAHLHGQILNKSDLADKAGVSYMTAERWLSVLEASNIIYLLKPFSANTRKRLVKSPKMYFLNSGLAARLQGFTEPGQLESSKEAGAYFEGFVLSEIIKSHLNSTGLLPEIYYYRDSNKNEIDIVLVEGLDLYPIEIKKAHRIQSKDAEAFRYLDEVKGYTRKSGAVIGNAEEPLPINENDWAIPVTFM